MLSTPVVALLLLAAVALYVLPADQRVMLARRVLLRLRRLLERATRKDPTADRFHADLRAQRSRVFVTPALVAMNLVVFVLMVFGTGRLDDAGTLISWGGNFGPRTTNGEWWRLLTSMFVHSGMLHVIVNMALLFQIGLLLERLVGYVPLVGLYVTAGIFASLSALSAYPMVVTMGASGGICGLLGLFLTTRLCTLRQPTRKIPHIVLERLAPAAAVFLVWNAVNGDMPIRGELAGFFAGIVGGVAVMKRAHQDAPPRLRLAVGAAAAAMLILVFAIDLRGISDVRPDIARLIALEEKTTGAYQSSVERLKKGAMPAEALAQMIVHTIVPDLQAADSHLKTIHGVPLVHQPLVADAREYLRLRTESWELRAEGLRKTVDVPHGVSTRGDPTSSAQERMRATGRYRAGLATLAKAEQVERASLEVFQRIRQDDAKIPTTTEPPPPEPSTVTVPVTSTLTSTARRSAASKGSTR